MKQVCVGLAMFFMIFVVSLNWILWLNSLEQTLVERGVRVQGTIVSQHIDGGKNTSYYFGVSYEGLQKPKDFEVTSYAYAGYSVGLHIPVVYDPQNPSNSQLFRVTPVSANGHLGWHLFFLTLVTSFVALIFHIELRMAKREQKQLIEWNLGYFVVEEVHPETGKSGGYRLIGHYSRGALAKMAGTVTNYNQRVKMNEEIPILYGPSGPVIVAISALTRVEQVAD